MSEAAFVKVCNVLGVVNLFVVSIRVFTFFITKVLPRVIGLHIKY